MNPETVQKFKAEIAETRGLIASLKTFVSGLFAQLRANKDDPAEVAAIISEFDAAQADLLAAMQENPAPGDPDPGA